MTPVIDGKRVVSNDHLSAIERETESASPFFCTEERDTVFTRYSRHELVGSVVALICIGLTFWLSPGVALEKSIVPFLALVWIVWAAASVYITSPTVDPGQLGSVSGHRAMNFYSLLCGATVLITGGHTSPAVPLLSLVALHQLNYPRRERMKAILWVLAPAVLTLLLLTLTEQDWVRPFPWREAVTTAWPVLSLGILVLAVAFHGLYVVERVRPSTTILQRESFPRFGYDPDNLLLFSSIMVRALKLYRADAGMVITASKQSQSGAESVIAYTALLSLNWPGVAPEPRQGKGRGHLLIRSCGESSNDLNNTEDIHEFDYILDALNGALRQRIGGFNFPVKSGGLHGLKKGIVFRIGPQCDAHDQKFIVLGAARSSAFRSPLNWRTTIFWNISLREMETAFLSAEWSRLLRATDSLDSLKNQLKSVCNDLVPEALRPVKTDIIPRIAGERPGYQSEPREYGKQLRYDPEPDRCVSTVTIDLLNPNGRWTHADIYVYVDSPATLLSARPEALASTKKLLNEFLANVFRGSMLLRLFQKAEENTDIGWAKLALAIDEQPDGKMDLRFITVDKLSTLSVLPSGQKYDQEFEKSGFQIIATDSLMKAWIPDVKFTGPQSICWKTYLQPDPNIQSGACRNCPVIRQLHAHLHSSDRSSIPDLHFTPSLPAPAPAGVGTLKITKHFFLSCELEFHPEFRSQVRSIIEQIEDRTLFFERGVLTHYLNEVGLNRFNGTLASNVFSNLAEALGRLFHADVIALVSTSGAESGQFIHRYCRVGYGGEYSDCVTQGFAAQESLVNRALRETNGDDDYLATLLRERTLNNTFLFAEDNVEECRNPLSRTIVLGIRNELAASRRHRRARECFRGGSSWLTSFPELFQRIIVVGIPFSDVAVLICTKAPEEWEYHAANPELGLLPRHTEMTATYEMAEQVGAVLRGVHGIQPDLYLTIYNDAKRALEHEIKHTARAISLNLGFINDILSGGFRSLRDALSSFSPDLDRIPAWDWLEAIEDVAMGRLQLPPGDVLALRRDYRELLASQALAIDMDCFAEVGLGPDSMRDITKLTVMPLAQQRAVVYFLRDYHNAVKALCRLDGVGQFVERWRYNEWSPDARASTYLYRLLESSLERVSLQPNVAVMLDVDRHATTLADPEQLALVVDNIIRNAVEAANDLKEPNTVIVEAKLSEEGWPTIRVSNEGNRISKETIAMLFLGHGRVHSTKGTDGTGVGVFAASQAAFSLGGWLMYDYRHHPKLGKPMNMFSLLSKTQISYDQN